MQTFSQHSRISMITRWLKLNIDQWQSALMCTACESVSAILEKREDGNRLAMGKRCGLPQPTISRIVAKKVMPSLESLQAIATAYNFQVWQLLVPGFNPDEPPLLRTMSKAEEAL